MNTAAKRFLIDFVLALALVAVGTAFSVYAEEESSIRDPFWPVGYHPTDQREIIMARPVVEDLPIDEEAWALAYAKLPRVGGIFVGTHPETGEKIDKMMMGGKTYYPDDMICLTNDWVEFIWTVKSISFQSNKYELSPVSAERVPKGGK